MGGVDKGLQNHRGMPLALHALLRLQPQVGEVMINANRNLGAYESFGVPVWPDALRRLSPARWPASWPGWSAARRRTWSPCPATRRLSRSTWSSAWRDALDARRRRHRDGRHARGRRACSAAAGVLPDAAPTLMESLVRFTHDGGRKIDRLDRAAPLRSRCPSPTRSAFFNANTLDELRQLQPR